MMVHLLLYGNAYAIINRNGGAKPISFDIIDPTLVSTSLGEDGKVYYETGERTYQSKEILHFVGLSYDGLIGKSPITACRKQLV